MLRFIVATLLLGASGNAGEISDRYRAYMDRLIPATFEIAREEVGLREKGVFRAVLSEAQSGLDEAIVRLSNVSIISTSFESEDASVCSVSSSEPAVTTLLHRLLQTSQLLNEAGRAKSALERVEGAIRSFEKACEGDRNIETYNIDTLYLSYLEPKIEAIEGTYLEFSGVVPLDALRAVGSFIKVVGNNIEQDQINDQMRRFREERARSEDYRKFAEEACAGLVERYQPYVSELRTLAHEASAMLEKVSLERAELRLLALEECVAERSEVSVADFREGIRDEVAASLFHLSEAEGKAAKSIQLNGKIHVQRAKLAGASCEDVQPVQELKSLVSASRLMRLPNLKTLVPRVEKEIASWISKCGKGLR